jgi:hypothetical protein
MQSLVVVAVAEEVLAMVATATLAMAVIGDMDAETITAARATKVTVAMEPVVAMTMVQGVLTAMHRSADTNAATTTTDLRRQLRVATTLLLRVSRMEAEVVEQVDARMRVVNMIARTDSSPADPGRTQAVLS